LVDDPTVHPFAVATLLANHGKHPASFTDATRNQQSTPQPVASQHPTSSTEAQHPLDFPFWVSCFQALADRDGNTGITAGSTLQAPLLESHCKQDCGTQLQTDCTDTACQLR